MFSINSELKRNIYNSIEFLASLGFFKTCSRVFVTYNGVNEAMWYDRDFSK